MNNCTSIYFYTLNRVIIVSMSRSISRNASEIINMFTTAMQEQQLESDKHEFNKFKEEINKKHKKYLGDKYKEE